MSAIKDTLPSQNFKKPVSLPGYLHTQEGAMSQK